MRRVVATTLAVASGSLLTASVAAFRRHRTTVDPVAVTTASTLVSSGAYRISRNPMYLGDVGLLAAYAVLRGTWQAWVPVGLFAGAIDRLQIPAEENALRERFGDAYEGYCAQVPRWVDHRSALFSTAAEPDAGTRDRR